RLRSQHARIRRDEYPVSAIDERRPQAVAGRIGRNPQRGGMNLARPKTAVIPCVPWTSDAQFLFRVFRVFRGLSTKHTKDTKRKRRHHASGGRLRTRHQNRCPNPAQTMEQKTAPTASSSHHDPYSPVRGPRPASPRRPSTHPKIPPPRIPPIATRAHATPIQ